MNNFSVNRLPYGIYLHMNHLVKYALQRLTIVKIFVCRERTGTHIRFGNMVSFL